MTGQRTTAGAWRWAIITADHLTATERHVALTLAVYMDPDGDGARPSVQTLAAATSRSKSTVLEALDQLDKLGWIDREIGAGRRATRYAATCPSGTPGVPQDACSGTAGVPQDEPDEARSGTDSGRSGTDSGRSGTPGVPDHPDQQDHPQGGGGEGLGEVDQVAAFVAQRLIDACPEDRRHEAERRRADLARALRQFHGRGLTPNRIVASLTERELDTANNIGGALLHRIGQLAKSLPKRTNGTRQTCETCHGRRHILGEGRNDTVPCPDCTVVQEVAS